MFFGSLAFVFEVMIYVGLGLPLLHLLASAIGLIGDSTPDVDADVSMDGGFDAADLDAPDLDAPDFDLDAPDVDTPDLDVDAGEFDAEAGGADIGAAGAGAHGGGGFPLRFNLYCLCLAFVVLGAVGIFALESLSGAAQIATLIGGAALAVAAYVLLYRFVIWPLKRNKASALRQDELKFRHAIVTFRVLDDSPGTIETHDAVGAVISYRAQIDTDICPLGRLEEGTEVIISEVDRAQNLCYVVPAQHKILKK